MGGQAQRAVFLFVNKGKVNPLQNDSRDKAQAPRHRSRGKLFGAYAGHHGRVDKADAPRQPAHGGNGGLAQNKGGFTIHIVLFIDRHHYGEHDQISGGHIGRQVSHAADHGGHDHHHHHIHLIAQQADHFVDDDIKQAGFGEHGEVDQAEQQHIAGRRHDRVELVQNKGAGFGNAVAQHEHTHGGHHEHDKVQRNLIPQNAGDYNHQHKKGNECRAHTFSLLVKQPFGQSCSRFSASRLRLPHCAGKSMCFAKLLLKVLSSVFYKACKAVLGPFAGFCTPYYKSGSPYL